MPDNTRGEKSRPTGAIEMLKGAANNWSKPIAPYLEQVEAESHQRLVDFESVQAERDELKARIDAALEAAEREAEMGGGDEDIISSMLFILDLNKPFPPE